MKRGDERRVLEGGARVGGNGREGAQAGGVAGGGGPYPRIVGLYRLYREVRNTYWARAGY